MARFLPVIDDIDSVSQADVFLLFKCFISVAMVNYSDCSALASKSVWGGGPDGPWTVQHAQEELENKPVVSH